MNKKKNIPFSPPDITSAEINEVIDTLKSGWITTGPKTKLFENEIAGFIGVEKVVCLSSATAAMELTLRLFGVGPGDEVITSAYTYTASASVIHHVGAKIILVDTSEGSYEMDYEKLREKITEKTKVIIPVDIAGIMCDYDKIFKIVNEKRNLFCPRNERQHHLGRILVMADAAHSFGAIRNGKKSGVAADISCFSFHAVKNLTTAEGGAISWTNSWGLSNEELYNDFMLYSLHGQSKDALSKVKAGSWEYDIIYPAYKCNMTDIQASIGLAQFRRYAKLLKHRHDLIEKYIEYLNKKEVKVLSHNGVNFTSSGHLLVCNILNLNIDKRNMLIKKLAEVGISSNVHYKPLPMLSAYKKLGFKICDFPNAYKMFCNEITLPLHTGLSEEDVEYVSKHVNNLIEMVKYV